MKSLSSLKNEKEVTISIGRYSITILKDGYSFIQADDGEGFAFDQEKLEELINDFFHENM